MQTSACGSGCVGSTSAGLELLGQNFADLVHPRRFNLGRRRLHQTNKDTYKELTALGYSSASRVFCLFCFFTCAIKTSSLELHQISNFLLSPLAFSVMPTALIWEKKQEESARSALLSLHADVKRNVQTPPT